MYPVPTVTHALATLPVEHIVEAGGIYFRSVRLEEAGTVIPQHVHDHDHVTFIGHGSARGWQDGIWIGDKQAGDCFEVAAGRQHLFQALEPQTLLTCVHNIDSALSLRRKGV